MELIDTVIADLRKHYEYPLRRIKGILRRNDRPNVERIAGLRLDRLDVLLSLKPLSAAHMLELDLYLSVYPEELESLDYPENILEWINFELMDWNDGDLLGSYLPEHKAIETYWLPILYCNNGGPPAEEIAMVANVHSWCHAMIDLAEDIDGRNLGFSGKLSPDLAEGLAQYYTHCFLDDMNDPKYYDTFVELLSFQPDVYRTHMSWLTTEDLEDYKEQSVNMGAPLVKVGDDGLGYITRSREIVRHTLLTHLREQPEMNVEEFNHHFDRTGQTVKQVIDLF